MKIPAFLFAALLFLSGCTIVQTIDLNEDQSGTYSVGFDYSGIGSMLDTDSTKFNPLEGVNVDSITDAIKMMDGISHPTIVAEEGNVLISYDFKNLEALNVSINNNGLEGSLTGNQTKPATEHIYFTGKKNTLSYTSTPVSKETQKSLEESGVMSSVITYKMVINLPHAIKKINNSDYKVSPDKKSLTFEVGADKVFSGEAKTDFTIKY